MFHPDTKMESLLFFGIQATRAWRRPGTQGAQGVLSTEGLLVEDVHGRIASRAEANLVAWWSKRLWAAKVYRKRVIKGEVIPSKDPQPPHLNWESDFFCFLGQKGWQVRIPHMMRICLHYYILETTRNISITQLCCDWRCLTTCHCSNAVRQMLEIEMGVVHLVFAIWECLALRNDSHQIVSLNANWIMQFRVSLPLKPGAHLCSFHLAASLR